MDYNHIIIFLDKFKKLIFQKEELKEIIIKIISEEVHHQIEKQSLKIKGGYIYIESSPILRSEILIHKKQILDKLKEVLPNNNFLDIK
jgi:thioredoxin-related protein